ncbi:hypothetical protein U1Q18_022890 [Sarracenia purpurea var. burkii]
MGLVFFKIVAPATPVGASKSRRNQNPNQRAPKSHKRKPVPRLFRLLRRFLPSQRCRAYSPPTGDRHRDPLTEKPDHAPHRITARSLCNFFLGLLLPTSHRISPLGTPVRKPKPSAPATGSASTPSLVPKILSDTGVTPDDDEIHNLLAGGYLLHRRSHAETTGRVSL